MLSKSLILSLIVPLSFLTSLTRRSDDETSGTYVSLYHPLLEQPPVLASFFGDVCTSLGGLVDERRGR